MKTKTFDCVEMKHKAGERIYQQLKGKTVEEQIEYWRKIEEKYKDGGKHLRPSKSLD